MPSNKPAAAKKPAQASGLKPGLAVLGTMLLWAALNEPAVLNPLSIALWALSALTIGLLASAALALATPLTHAALVLLAWISRQMKRPAEDA